MASATTWNAPHGANTVIALTKRANEKGFGSGVRTFEGGTLRCLSCESYFDADAYDVRFEQRLEGATDVADMVLLVAGICPACSIGSTLVLGYGPNSDGVDADVVTRLDLTDAQPLVD